MKEKEVLKEFLKITLISTAIFSYLENWKILNKKNILLVEEHFMSSISIKA